MNGSKYNIVAIIGLVALVVFLILPLVSASMGGTEIMAPKGLDYVLGETEVTFLGETRTIEIDLKLGIILIIVSAVVVVIGAFKRIKKLSFISAIVGGLIVLANIGSAAEEFANLGAGASASVGLGMWIPLICFIAAAVLSLMADKEASASVVAEEAPQQFNQQF